jgi:hypothetical protein
MGDDAGYVPGRDADIACGDWRTSGLAGWGSRLRRVHITVERTETRRETVTCQEGLCPATSLQVPRGEPDRVDCLESQGILDGYAWSFGGVSIAVSSSATRCHERSLLVLCVRWFVSRDARPARSDSNATTSASGALA